MNYKSEENRKYFSLYNTVQDTKTLFNQEINYLREINELYKQANSKKAKEVLLHNLKNIEKIVGQNVVTSQGKLDRCRNEYRQVQTQFDECIFAEKDHFTRIKEFEAACDKNDELREKLGM